MPEDHLERKTYRKSPGRQYGYEYDPLQSRSGKSQSGSTANKSGMLLSQRPDPRRTRQLLRQHIIASRRQDDDALEDDQLELHEPPMAPDGSRPTRRIQHYSSSEEHLRPSGGHIARTRFIPMNDEGEPLPPRYGARGNRGAASAGPHQPGNRELMHEDDFEQEAWPYEERRHYVDPDLGIDEDLDELEQEPYDSDIPLRARSDRAGASARASDQARPRRATTRHLPEELLEKDFPEHDPDEGHIYEEDEQLPSGLRVVNKPSSSRRKFLIGAGVVVAGGAGVGLVAAQSAGPKPKAPPPPTPSNNVDKQMKDAANKAADDARRALLAELDSIESFTLQGAIEAARLTRVSYDVFVAPIVKFGSAITGDFLTGMLNAFKVARNWLAGINQDNVTLAAIQKVLESWVTQVQNLPKQLSAITQTDMDGAQAYLRALQRKIDEEKKKLQDPNAQGTPSTTPKK